MRKYLLIFANWPLRKAFESSINMGVFNKAYGTWRPFPDQEWQFCVPNYIYDLDRFRGIRYDEIECIGTIKLELLEYANALLRKVK
jgi:hypothetical protein